jgi:ferritin-like metal-binding protein YciE
VPPPLMVSDHKVTRGGSPRSYASRIDEDDDAVPLLQETLDEQKATDDALTEIAKTAINQQAEAA